MTCCFFLSVAADKDSTYVTIGKREWELVKVCAMELEKMIAYQER